MIEHDPNEVLRILRERLTGIMANDTTPPYRYGQKRKFDGAVPADGERWLTPREIAAQTIQDLGCS